MRNDVRVREISNGFIAEYDKESGIGRSAEEERYFKDIKELNEFLAIYYKKYEIKPVGELKDV